MIMATARNIDVEYVEMTRGLVHSDNESDDGNMKFTRHDSIVQDVTYQPSMRKRLKRFLFLNPTTRLASMVLDFVLSFLICTAYATRVHMDVIEDYACAGDPCTNETMPDYSQYPDYTFTSVKINWYVLVWIRRPIWLWLMEVILAVAFLIKFLVFLVALPADQRLKHFLCLQSVIIGVAILPLVVTVVQPTTLRDLFVPSFLCIWLSRGALKAIQTTSYQARQGLQSMTATVAYHTVVLGITLVSGIFITVCGIQHIQRGSWNKRMTLFEALYFVIVTFSTVGYGDICPDIFLGQLFILIMIIFAVATIPHQIEKIVKTWVQRQSTGTLYTRSNHVVVCSTSFSYDTIMDFLNEFYAHVDLKRMEVVLLSSEPLEGSTMMILRDPKWMQRVYHVTGSALSDINLYRCNLREAQACFLLPPRLSADKDKADQQTLLRSLAIKDYAPNCKQYIRLFKATSKLHVRFADHLVCEDEFKYALLANNCLYPGLSTLVSLLVHTSTGLKQHFPLRAEDVKPNYWQQMYGHHAANEIYHIRLERSSFFSAFAGISFTRASAKAHQRYGVALLAVLGEDGHLMLNPGTQYLLRASDTCLYLSVTRDEDALIGTGLVRSHGGNFTASCSPSQMQMHKSTNSDSQEIQGAILEAAEEEAESPIWVKRNLLDEFTEVRDALKTGNTQISMYTGFDTAHCYLMREPRPYCCLEWNKDCEHANYRTAKDERWWGNVVILGAQQATSGLHNFLVPLRLSFLSTQSLIAIILLLENRPDQNFLDLIAQFPLVFWMEGSITSMQDLLCAGLHKARHLVVVSREPKSADDQAFLETAVDSDTVISLQSISSMFPSTSIMTELIQASNMRFMQFRPSAISKLDKSIRATMEAKLSHIFREPFAAGHIFSSSMLDSLLYQTFVKGYLITFVRLLLGLDAEIGSGHLSSIKVTEETARKWATFGELYSTLANAHGEIPFAVYHSQRKFEHSLQSGHPTKVQNAKEKHCCRRGKSPPKQVRFSVSHVPFTRLGSVNMRDIVLKSMQHFGVDENVYKRNKAENTVSFVIANPSPKYKLKVGDIVYVIQPSAMQSDPNNNKLVDRRTRTSPRPQTSLSSSTSRKGPKSLPSAARHPVPHAFRPRHAAASDTEDRQESEL